MLDLAHARTAHVVIPTSRGGWLLTGLVVAVLAVLIHGLAQRLGPTFAPAETPEPVSASPVRRPDLEKTPLAYQSDYWRQLGERTRPKILLVGVARIPAIVIAPGLAVSSAGIVDEQTESFKVVGGPTEFGLALLEVAPAAAPEAFAPSDSGSLHPGLLVAAVSLAPDGRLLVVPGTLASAPVRSEEESDSGDEDSLDVSIAFPRSLPAAAIVDLDGQLVGAAFDVGGSLRLLSSGVLLRVVDRLRRHPFCHAIEVGEIDERVKDLLNVRGVMVERVRETSFVPAPAIREGDVLLEWGGREVESPEEFRRSYEAQEAGALVSFEVRRGRSRVRGRTVMPGSDCRPAGGSQVLLSGIGMTLRRTDEPETGWEVLTLTPGGPAARGGIAIFDRILQVDGLPLGSGGLEMLRSFERRHRALPFLVRRDRRVRLLAVSPNAE
jgi:S1-C subfamily serine protease